MDPEPNSPRRNSTITQGALYLGVDGGGSRCRARIADEFGTVVSEVGSGPATTRLSIDEAWRSIMRAYTAAAEQAPLGREDFALVHAGIGLVSLGRWGAAAALKQIAHPFASVHFISDGVAACLGANGGADGAIVVAGTGSIGVGPIGGRELRFGFSISDEGSGAGVGLQAIRLAFRAADQRGETSPLLAEVLGAFDHDSSQAVAWFEPATVTDYAAFAPLVLRHASQGDPIGRRIVERAANAIGDLLDVFLRHGIDRLSLVGGLSGAIAAWLTPDLRGRLTPPVGDVVAGALLVARGRVAVVEAAEREQVPKFRLSNP